MSGKPHPRQIRLHYTEVEMSLTEVAQEIGISPQAVQQIEVKALKKLKREAKKLGMDVFLEGI